jgi:hypothetical protein
VLGTNKEKVEANFNASLYRTISFVPLPAQDGSFTRK